MRHNNPFSNITSSDRGKGFYNFCFSMNSEEFLEKQIKKSIFQVKELKFNEFF